MIKPMLCGEYNPEKHRNFPYMVQPKLDGVRCITYNCQAHTRNQKPHKGHINDILCGVKIPGVVLDGELMLEGGTFQETVSAVKKDSANSKNLVYHVYDCFDRLNPRFTFIQRFNILARLVDWWSHANVSLVNAFEVVDADGLDLYHNLFCEKGFEGSIIRDPRACYAQGSRKHMWKRKDFYDAEFIITGVHEGTGKNAGTPVFECCTEGKSFRCSPAGTYAYKRRLWGDRLSLVNRAITVKFQGYTDGGIPRFPVGLEIRDYE